jgi:hypothetical protein
VPATCPYPEPARSSPYPDQNNSIKEPTNTKFQGLELDKHINWKNHINKILPKLSTARFVVRPRYSYSNMSTLRKILNTFLLQWSVALYFGGTRQIARKSSYNRIIRIMTGLSSRTSCKPSFQRLELLTSSTQYIVSLMRFLKVEFVNYTFDSTTNGFSIRNKLQLHKQSTILTIYQTAY